MGIDGFDIWGIGWIKGVKWFQHFTNTKIWEQTKYPLQPIWRQCDDDDALVQATWILTKTLGWNWKNRSFVTFIEKYFDSFQPILSPDVHVGR